jgi:hypothetical protein
LNQHVVDEIDEMIPALQRDGDHKADSGGHARRDAQNQATDGQHVDQPESGDGFR